MNFPNSSLKPVISSAVVMFAASQAKCGIVGWSWEILDSLPTSTTDQFGNFEGYSFFGSFISDIGQIASGTRRSTNHNGFGEASETWVKLYGSPVRTVFHSPYEGGTHTYSTAAITLANEVLIRSFYTNDVNQTYSGTWRDQQGNLIASRPGNPARGSNQRLTASNEPMSGVMTGSQGTLWVSSSNALLTVDGFVRDVNNYGQALVTAYENGQGITYLWQNGSRSSVDSHALKLNDSGSLILSNGSSSYKIRTGSTDVTLTMPAPDLSPVRLFNNGCASFAKYQINNQTVYYFDGTQIYDIRARVMNPPGIFSTLMVESVSETGLAVGTINIGGRSNLLKLTPIVDLNVPGQLIRTGPAGRRAGP